MDILLVGVFVVLWLVVALVVALGYGRLVRNANHGELNLEVEDLVRTSQEAPQRSSKIAQRAGYDEYVG